MYHLQAQITGLHDCIRHYEHQFERAPKGYVINDRQVPQFYILLGNGVFWPAKWVNVMFMGYIYLLWTYLLIDYWVTV